MSTARTIASKKDLVLHIISVLKPIIPLLHPSASSHVIAIYGKNPFLILVSCILSLRTRDVVSLAASKRLFDRAKTPDQMLVLGARTIERYIYPVGFYHRKANSIIKICRILIDHYGGNVPPALDDLLALPGVGLKTANLVLAEAFDVPALCVDTHVHALSNKLGIVTTKNPEQTYAALKDIIPPRYWRLWSRLLVVYGQNRKNPLLASCTHYFLARACTTCFPSAVSLCVLFLWGCAPLMPFLMG
jgi:endonuclease III